MAKHRPYVPRPNASPRRSAAGRLNIALRIHKDDPDLIDERRRDFAVAVAAEEIDKALALSPALTDAQRTRLCTLILTHPGGALVNPQHVIGAVS